MGSEWVDPGWNALGTSLINAFRNAPKEALSQKSMVEQIMASRAEQARKQAIFDANTQSGQSVADTLGTFGPPKSVRDITVQPEGPINPDDPATFLPPVQRKEEYVDPIVEARYKAELPMYQSIARAVAQGQGGGDLFNTYGRATAGLQGVPTDLAERERLNVILTGKLLPPGERKAPNGQNLSVIGADGKATGRGYMSFDGGRTAQDGTPIRLGPGEQLMETGPAPLAKANPIESQPIAQNNFNEMAIAIREKIARKEPISNRELDAARATRDAGWGRKTHFGTDANTGAPTVTPYYEVEPPTAGPSAELLRLLDAVDAAQPGRPAAQPPAPAPDPLAAVPPPADQNAPPPPIVEPPAGPRPLAGTPQTIGPGAAKPVVDQYTSHVVVKAMDLAQSGYSSMVQNMPYDNAASDLALFIGAAKVLDPPSVVREQEGKNVSRTASPMDQFYGMLNRAQGGSGLTREARAQIWNMVNEKLRRDIENVIPLRQQHVVQLKQRGINDPDTYLPPLPTISEVKREMINSTAINANDPSRPLHVPSTIDPYGGTPGVTTGPRGGRAAPVPPPPAVIERGNAVFGAD